MKQSDFPNSPAGEEVVARSLLSEQMKGRSGWWIPHSGSSSLLVGAASHCWRFQSIDLPLVSGALD
jgi:hypothetical protein